METDTELLYKEVLSGVNHLEKNASRDFTMGGLNFSDAENIKSELSNYAVEMTKGKDMKEGYVLKISKLEENLKWMNQ